ncbi:hypothetical protein HPB47_017899, partial [Ixodes persulcatus]
MGRRQFPWIHPNTDTQYGRPGGRRCHSQQLLLAASLHPIEICPDDGVLSNSH